MLPAAPGTVTDRTDPFATRRNRRPLPEDATACRYRPPGSRRAPTPPGSWLRRLRCGVSAVGLPPLAGTSQNRSRLVLLALHQARIVPEFHHRDGKQPPALAPGTGSLRMTPPPLLTSCTPPVPATASAVPVSEYTAVVSSGPVARTLIKCPDRL